VWAHPGGGAQHLCDASREEDRFPRPVERMRFYGQDVPLLQAGSCGETAYVLYGGCALKEESRLLWAAPTFSRDEDGLADAEVVRAGRDDD